VFGLHNTFIMAEKLGWQYKSWV